MIEAGEAEGTANPSTGGANTYRLNPLKGSGRCLPVSASFMSFQRLSVPTLRAANALALSCIEGSPCACKTPPAKRTPIPFIIR
jgi:hypothetical protein